MITVKTDPRRSLIYKVINIWITPEAYLGLGNEIPVQRRCDQEIELVKWCTEAEQKDDTDIARPHLFSLLFFLVQ